MWMVIWYFLSFEYFFEFFFPIDFPHWRRNISVFWLKLPTNAEKLRTIFAEKTFPYGKLRRVSNCASKLFLIVWRWEVRVNSTVGWKRSVKCVFHICVQWQWHGRIVITLGRVFLSWIIKIAKFHCFKFIVSNCEDSAYVQCCHKETRPYIALHSPLHCHLALDVGLTLAF